MKLKKEYIILGLVILALVLYLVFHKTDRALYQLPALPEVAGKDIDRLDIKLADRSVELNKKDNRWRIAPADYLAETSQVDGMLDALEELMLTALVSESKSYARYDLSDDRKITVTAWDGDTEKRRIDIGKAAPTYQHTFVLLTDDPNIYHASGNFRSKFDKTVEKLRDKTVLSFEKKQVQSLRVTKGDKTRTFALSTPSVDIAADQEKDNAEGSAPSSGPGMEWMTEDNEKADESTIDSLLTQLERMKCDAYQDNETKDDLGKAPCRIELGGATARVLALYDKGEGEESRHPAASSDNDYPFYLSDYQGKNILEKIDKLLGIEESE